MFCNSKEWRKILLENQPKDLILQSTLYDETEKKSLNFSGENYSWGIETLLKFYYLNVLKKQVHAFNRSMLLVRTRSDSTMGSIGTASGKFAKFSKAFAVSVKYEGEFDGVMQRCGIPLNSSRDYFVKQKKRLDQYDKT